ncbi:MAG: ROK family protein [Planctomycetota bacterium]
MRANLGTGAAGMPLLGGIEAGGTKLVCAVSTNPARGLLARTRFSTGDDPSALLAQVCEWFAAQERQQGSLAALGVASFGPLDLDPRSPTYGFITTTPKRGWAQCDVLGPLRRAFPGRPIGFDTDVNGAALGEGRFGAARGLEDFLYITVGTGIGGGGLARGSLLHGLVHPEMGHIAMPRLDGDSFEGACPFHGRCWEGLCSGPAIARRVGAPAELLAADHPEWERVARYMGFALGTLTCVVSPRRIVLGGSVRRAGQLGETEFFRRMRAELARALGGYIESPALRDRGLDGFLVPPELGDDAGVLGALALAQDALLQSAPPR